MSQSPRHNPLPLTDFLFAKASRGKIPFSGTFELSPVCNFSCRMCYVRKTPQEVQASPRPIMTLQQWLQIAQDAREMGLLYILLTGGEPFLWPDFWELYEKLCEMGFLVSINTNGSLIDDAAVARLRKHPPRRINITLYGACDETYETLCRAKHVFSRVDAAICKLKDAGISVKLNCSLTPQNACDLEKIIQYSQEKQLVLQVQDYMFPPVRRDEHMVGQNERFTPAEAAAYRMKAFRLQYGEERYRAHLRAIQAGYAAPPSPDESCVDPVDGKIRCRAGKSTFWVTWDGWLTPCGMMNKPRVDTSTQPFAAAWHELNDISAQISTSGICAKCSNVEICHPCAAMALAETGSFAGIPRYLCETARELQKIAASANDTTV